jgi:DNA-binding NarL/FixJ family response regulator
MAPQRPRVLIVDDHPVVRMGLRAVIEQSGRYEVCGEAGAPAEALKLAAGEQPDLIILDLMLGGRGGADFVTECLRLAPATRVLVLSQHDETLYAERVLAAGARGYLMKGEELGGVVEALAAIMRGEIVLSPRMNARILARRFHGAPHGRYSELSNREMQIFLLIGAEPARGHVRAVAHGGRLLAGGQPEIAGNLARLRGDARHHRAPDRCACGGGRRGEARDRGYRRAVRAGSRGRRRCRRGEAHPHRVRAELAPRAGGAEHAEPRARQFHLQGHQVFAVGIGPAAEGRTAWRGVRISVSDRGPGIAPEEATLLFGKFARLSALPTAAEPSSGLGLYIVRILAERMGAVAGWEPNSEGGSVFFLDLPSEAGSNG